MAGLKDRVGSLLGGRRKGPRLAGWVRTDADHVIRGWVVDPASLGRRVVVEVRVGGEPIATVCADRFDAKLVELGHGDGRHAFEVVVPARFRDGAPHRFEAIETQADYRLMSRAETLNIPASAAEPQLVVTQVGVEGVTGTLSAGQYARDVQLEVWRGEDRMAGLSTSWRPRGPVSEFSLSWPADTLFALDPSARIAGPGMYEAGLGACIFAAARLWPQLTSDGLKVAVQGPIALPAGTAAHIRLLAADGRELARGEVRDRAAILYSPANLASAAGLQLVCDGQAVAGLDTPFDLHLGALVSNGEFRGWAAGLPAGWATGAAAGALSRGFYAFPQAASGAAGARSGDLVRFDLPPAGEPQLLLAQDLPIWPSVAAPASALMLMARTSEPGALQLRLLAADGQPVQSLDLATVEPWTWTLAQASLHMDGASAVRVEVSLAPLPAADLTVEIACVRVGGADDPDASAQSQSWGLPANLVENGDLTDWPRGLQVQGGGGRVECAAGWFVQNRKAAQPVAVRAWSGQDGGFGMTVAADEVADYCRLEARLHPQALSAGPRLRLSFDAGIPADVPQAFQHRRPFVVIERLFLLRRGRKAAEAGFSLSLDVVATVARRLVVGCDLQRFSFDIDVGAAGPGDLQDPELFVAFDFNNAFSILLHNVALAAAPTEPTVDCGLLLEDPAIAVQAATLKGLGAWLSVQPVQPGAGFEPALDALGSQLRWSFPADAADSVEVVICVHDAADEALACLQSLVTASSLPHSVRIIDDGSGEDTRRRLLELIADKPWMRMISSPVNRGYTASANIGIRGSAAAWVILLNSDTVVTPGWIEGLMACAASDPAIAMVGPVSNAASYQSLPELKDRQGRWKVNALPPGWTPRRMAAFVAGEADMAFPTVPLLNGFCTLIRRDVFLALGGFNEAAFPQGYGEENDLCVRAAAAGHKLAVADQVYVYHAKSASFGSARRAELQKAAGKALAELHPDADFSALGDRLREVPALSRLRAKLRTLYEAQG